LIDLFRPYHKFKQDTIYIYIYQNVNCFNWLGLGGGGGESGKLNQRECCDNKWQEGRCVGLLDAATIGQLNVFRNA
jgi:hypothetical protein